MKRDPAKNTVDGVTNLDVLLFQRNKQFSSAPGALRQLNWLRDGHIISRVGSLLVGQQLVLFTSMMAHAQTTQNGPTFTG